MAVIPFSAGQRDVLRQLSQVWGPERFVLIGASALGCFLDMRWRGTADLDLTLTVSLEEYLDQTIAPGWKRDARMEQRWCSPGGEIVDIIPAGPELLRQGEVQWPRTGHKMRLTGLRLAFERAVPVSAAADLTVRVAPVPVLTVLKMVAYRDRPTERARDVADLAYILTDYDPGDRFADDVIDLGLSYEEVGPFLLGRTIAEMVNDAERTEVERFVREGSDEDDPSGIHAKLLALGPPSWRRDPGELIQCMRAFSQGLG
ncbi:MAG: nucleotidyl transferase AbiEii/AbiGii toxin family protein [candidate division NC10 bacterium]|nr:nucleotidyl transferase AbiEii/AbiGii toxin family protein [candidate division NC10 bacterium]